MSTSVFDQSKIEPNTQIRTENHIYENERDFYISRLHCNITKLKRSLLLCLLITLTDLAVCYLYPRIFQNLLNISIILVKLIWLIISFGMFFRTFSANDEIDIKTYKKVVYSLYLSISITIIVVVNLAYITLTKILLKYSYWSEYFSPKEKRNEMILSICGFAAYLIGNCMMMINIAMKFGKIRKTLKSVGNLQGQEYSVTYTVSVPSGLGLESGRRVEIKSDESEH